MRSEKFIGVDGQPRAGSGNAPGGELPEGSSAQGNGASRRQGARAVEGAPHHAIPAVRAGDHDLPSLGMRVLVVEDNPVNQIILARQLRRLGCIVAVAADGERALAMWRANACDVLLTDVNMPGMDGCRLSSAIRESGDRRPIIGVLGDARCDEQRRCREAGMTAWLAKPVRLRTLWNFLVDHARSGPGGGADAADAVDPAISPVMDPTRHEGRRDGFRNIFISTMTDDIRKLEQAAAGGDRPAMFALLHRMGGALTVAGFTDQSLAFATLGMRLRDGEPVAQVMADAGERLDTLRQLVKRE